MSRPRRNATNCRASTPNRFCHIMVMIGIRLRIAALPRKIFTNFEGACGLFATGTGCTGTARYYARSIRNIGKGDHG